MRVRFWGTRGSLPTPGRGTVRYGGNTSCVEVLGDAGTRVVLDSGTGVRDLGESLLESPDDTPCGHLFITHTHWDHIQGFPFFRPLFVRRGEWDIYGPGTEQRRIDTVLGRLFDTTFFPVGLDQIETQLRFHTLTEGTVELEGARITAHYLNHPALTLGYRIEMDGACLVYAVDHEPHSRYQPEVTRVRTARAEEGFAHPLDGHHVDFLAGADLVVHDAMYSAREYPERISWGHSSAEQAVDYAVAAGVPRLALSHHDPGRDDDAMDLLVERCRHRATAAGGGLEVFGASEGEAIELCASSRGRHTLPVTSGACLPAVPDQVPAPVLIVSADAARLGEMARALEAEGLQVITADDGLAGAAMARSAPPALVLADSTPSDHRALDLCAALRREPGTRATPVLILGDPNEPEDIGRAFAAGATDYLTKPCKLTYIQARVLSWLLHG